MSGDKIIKRTQEENDVAQSTTNSVTVFMQSSHKAGGREAGNRQWIQLRKITSQETDRQIKTE